MKKKILKLFAFIIVIASLMICSINVSALSVTEVFRNYPAYPEVFRYLSELKSMKGGETGDREITFTKMKDVNCDWIYDNYEGNSYLYYDDYGRVIHEELIFSDMMYEYEYIGDGIINRYWFLGEEVYGNTWKYNKDFLIYNSYDEYDIVETGEFVQDKRIATFDNHGRVIRVDNVEGWSTYFEYHDTDLHEAHSLTITPYEGVSTINNDQNTGTKFTVIAVTSPDVEEVSILADKLNGEEWHEITFDYLENNYKASEYINEYNQKVWVYEFAINEIGYRQFVLKINGCRTNVMANAIVLPNDGTYTGSFSPTPQQGDIDVVVNGNYVNFDVPPQIINDRTMIPLRAVTEALGGTVEWYDDIKTALIECYNEKEGIMRTCRIHIGNSVMEWEDSGSWIAGGDSGITELDSPAVIVDGRTLVPFRAIAETFGFNVEWDDATKTVSIY